ncbi:MAG: glutamate--tRNA ligase [Candidatus Aminicenantes bacterium]|nr:glutamate--tRNA ligase [Candidatus Aminicenantes bacterium]
MSMNQIRVRFAPSPTGYIHVGNARTALFNWLFARQKGGIFILRVEDTDIERSKEEYEKRLIDDLRWLGLDWDEGPDIGGAYGPYRQSERLEIYAYYAQKLIQSGQAYYCFCSPEELEKEREEALAKGLLPRYSGRCRHIPLEKALSRLNSGEKAAIRLKVPSKGELGFHDLIRGDLTFDLSLIGDPILLRSNGLPAYNYAVVIDDHLMAISHVIRGEDHISNTPRQLLVYRSLGFDPPLFAHLSMVMGKDNTRLSKRHGATSLDQFAQMGILPEALFNYLAFLGWAPPEGQEVLSRDELIALFDLKKVSRSAAIFDYEKLYWLNRQHLKRLTLSEKAKKAYPFLLEAGLLPKEMTSQHWSWLEKAVDNFLETVNRLDELPERFRLLFDFSPENMDKEAREILDKESSLRIVKLFCEKIKTLTSFNLEVFNQVVNEIKKETGAKGKELYHPIRIALTARASGLELDRLIPLIEEGTKLTLPKPIPSWSERAQKMLHFLDNRPFFKV